MTQVDNVSVDCVDNCACTDSRRHNEGDDHRNWNWSWPCSSEDQLFFVLQDGDDSE